MTDILTLIEIIIQCQIQIIIRYDKMIQLKKKKMKNEEREKKQKKEKESLKESIQQLKESVKLVNDSVNKCEQKQKTTPIKRTNITPKAKNNPLSSNITSSSKVTFIGVDILNNKDETAAKL